MVGYKCIPRQFTSYLSAEYRQSLNRRIAHPSSNQSHPTGSQTDELKLMRFSVAVVFVLHVYIGHLKNS